MSNKNKQEEVRQNGIDNLKAAYAKLINIFAKSDCTTKNWVDMAPLPANITWGELQELSKLIGDGLCDLLHYKEPFWIRGWAYLDGMATKQIMDMMNEEKQAAKRVQPIDGPSQSSEQPREDSSNEDCSSPAQP